MNSFKCQHVAKLEKKDLDPNDYIKTLVIYFFLKS